MTLVPNIKEEDMLTTRACKSCVHKGVCKFSKDFETLSKELREKTKLIEYQNFIPEIKCRFYEKTTEKIKHNIDNTATF